MQAYLHRKSEHSESLKRSTPYAQALLLIRICTIAIAKPTVTFYRKNLSIEDLKKTEIYDSKSKTFDRNRGDLLTQNDETIIVFTNVKEAEINTGTYYK